MEEETPVEVVVDQVKWQVELVRHFVSKKRMYALHIVGMLPHNQNIAHAFVTVLETQSHLVAKEVYAVYNLLHVENCVAH